MAFASIAELVEFTEDDTLGAGRGQLLVDQASAVIRNYCRQTFDAVVDDTVELRGTWSRKLLLPERPVTAVGTVLVDGEAVTDFDRVADVLYRPHWGGPAVVVTVTYSHGFQTGDAALDTLKSVCLQVAARAAANPQSLESYSSDGTSLNFGGAGFGLSAAEQATLDRLGHLATA